MKLKHFLRKESRISDEEVLDILASSFTDDQEVFDDLEVSADGKFHFDLKNTHVIDYGNRGNFNELLKIHDRFQIESCADIFIYMPPGVTSEELQWLPRSCSSACNQYQISGHGEFDVSILPTTFHNNRTSFKLYVEFSDFEDHVIFKGQGSIRLNPLNVLTFKGWPKSVNSRISFDMIVDEPFNISIDDFPERFNNAHNLLYLALFIEAHDLKELSKRLKYCDNSTLILDGNLVKNLSYASRIKGLRSLSLEGPPEISRVSSTISAIVCSEKNFVDVQAELEELLIPLNLEHII